MHFPELSGDIGARLLASWLRYGGFTFYGQYMYTLWGGAYPTRLGDTCAGDGVGNTHIASYDLNSSTLIDFTWSVAGASLPYREPEGMAIQVVNNQPRLCFGFASGCTNGRVANVYYKTALI